jgi:hypothetical protein
MKPGAKIGATAEIALVGGAALGEAVEGSKTGAHAGGLVQACRHDRARPDFLSFNVDDLPHKIPFLVKEFTDAPIMVWTVKTAEQREAAHKWADQIVFDGDPEAHRSWRRLSYAESLIY